MPANLSTDQVQEVTDNEQLQKWRDAPLAQLADHIEQTHHVFLKEKLPPLREVVDMVVASHSKEHPWLNEFKEVYIGFQETILEHNKDEDEKLFPIVRDLDGKDFADLSAQKTMEIRQLVGKFVQEHHSGNDALKKLRKLSSDFTPPEDACGGFRFMFQGAEQIEKDTLVHLRKEDEILFPRLLSLIG